MITNKELLNHFYQSFQTRFYKCLYPFSECNNPPIRAHSIQNSRVFDQISSKNHLITIRSRRDSKHRPPQYDRIGRKEASTFEGLCAQHDEELFKSIDKSDYDPSSPEQLFLIAYRSVLKEFHACMSGAIKVQSGYQKKVELGLIRGDIPTKEGIRATGFLVNAYECNIYKENFDRTLMENDYSFLNHIAFSFDSVKPTIAVSQMFSADSVTYKDDVLRMVLNVFPSPENKIHIIFSSTAGEFSLAKDYVAKCLEGHDDLRMYEISKIIIRNCENLFINPEFFDYWSKDKRSKILDCYIRSMYEDFDEDHIEYMLFDHLTSPQ